MRPLPSASCSFCSPHPLERNILCLGESITMRIDDAIEQALRSGDPQQQLRSLAQGLFGQGQSSASVLALFESARQQLRDSGREADEDVLMDVMDCLVGWCG